MHSRTRLDASELIIIIRIRISNMSIVFPHEVIEGYNKIVADYLLTLVSSHLLAEA